jgi:hypothetical protein
MSGTELQPAIPTVVDRVTGEVLSVRDASTEQLAEFTTNCQQAREEIGDAERIVSNELLDRLDKSAAWTQRVGSFELKAPSPTAGTETYPSDMLRDALVQLVDARTISEDAAGNALQRRLVLELAVPWHADPAALATAVKEAITIQVADVIVDVVKAEAATRVSAAGIKAVRKVPGTTDALDAAKLTQPAGARRVKVTRKSPRGAA